MTYRPVPGPKGHPFLGSMLKFASDPAEFLLHTAIEYGDIAQFSVLGRRYYLIIKPDYVQEVLVIQSEKFRKSRLDVGILGKFLGRGILLTEGNYHRRQRKLVQPAFHTTRIQMYADTMVAFTQRMIAQWTDGSVQPIDIAMRQLTMEIVAKSLFDADMSDRAGILGEAIETLQHVAGIDFRVQNMIPDWLPLARNRRRAAASDILDSVIRQTINERRAAGEDKGDLLSLMLLSED
jgi:cytochrome P450